MICPREIKQWTFYRVQKMEPLIQIVGTPACLKIVETKCLEENFLMMTSTVSVIILACHNKLLILRHIQGLTNLVWHRFWRLTSQQQQAARPRRSKRNSFASASVFGVKPWKPSGFRRSCSSKRGRFRTLCRWNTNKSPSIELLHSARCLCRTQRNNTSFLLQGLESTDLFPWEYKQSCVRTETVFLNKCKSRSTDKLTQLHPTSYFSRCNQEDGEDEGRRSLS